MEKKDSFISGLLDVTLGKDNVLKNLIITEEDFLNLGKINHYFFHHKLVDFMLTSRIHKENGAKPRVVENTLLDIAKYDEYVNNLISGEKTCDIPALPSLRLGSYFSEGDEIVIYTDMDSLANMDSYNIPNIADRFERYEQRFVSGTVAHVSRTNTIMANIAIGDNKIKDLYIKSDSPIIMQDWEYQYLKKHESYCCTYIENPVYTHSSCTKLHYGFVVEIQKSAKV